MGVCVADSANPRGRLDNLDSPGLAGPALNEDPRDSTRLIVREVSSAPADSDRGEPNAANALR